ncbi:MAG: hypothetical protein KDA68_04205, partial [Planctomycetaceae bacterium]|nr:hypothetical protein [Planctomycetaceae bacterium]
MKYVWGMVGVCCLVLASAGRLRGGELRGEEGGLAITSPTPYQVIQRIGYVPREAHEHNPGGPKLGYADVAIRVKLVDKNADRIEARLKDQVPPTDGRLPQTGEEWS